MSKPKIKKCPICGAKWKKPFWHLWYSHTKDHLAKWILETLGLEGPSRG